MAFRPDFIGTQGETGLGITGPAGAGFTGLRGSTGLRGDTGPGGLGETGLRGSTGLRGDTGPQGETGIPGQGITGLVGTTGLQGETGVQGLSGDTGLTGFTGLKGAQGQTGMQGLQGITGLDGVTGLDGSQGETGAQGQTGPQSSQGETGLQGATGLEGSQGETGLIGETGAQGVTGINGSIDMSLGSETSLHTISTSVSKFETVDGYLYAARNSQFLDIYDVRDPESPVSVSTYDTGISEFIDRPEILNNFCVLPIPVSNLLILDIEDKKNPSLLKNISVGAYEVKIVDSVVFAAIGTSGLRAYDLTDSNYSQIYSDDQGGDYRCIAQYGSYLYVGARSSGCHIYNIEDPRNPSFVKTVGLGFSDVRFCACGDNLLAVSSQDDDKVELFDLSDPENPSSTWSASIVNPVDLNFSGKYLFVPSNDDQYLRIYNTEDYSSPSLERTIDESGNDYWAQIYGGYLFVGVLGSSIKIYRVNSLKVPGLEAASILAGDFTAERNLVVGNIASVRGSLTVSSIFSTKNAIVSDSLQIGPGVPVQTVGLFVTNNSNTSIDIVADIDNDEADTDVGIRFAINGAIGGGGTVKGDIRYDEGIDAFTMGYSKGDISVDSSGNVTFVNDVLIGYQKSVKYDADNFMVFRDTYGMSINSARSIYLNIDGNNNDTTRKLIVGHNNTGDSSTELFSVHESNGTKVTGTLEVTTRTLIGTSTIPQEGGVGLVIADNADSAVDIVADVDNDDSDTDVVLRFAINGIIGSGGTVKGDIRYDEGIDAFTMGYSKGDISVDSSGNVTFVNDIIVGVGKHLKLNDNNYFDVRGSYGSSWNCTGSIYVNIDDDAASTTKSFVVGHNATEDGGTELFSVHESNGTKVTGAFEATGDIKSGARGIFGTLSTDAIVSVTSTSASVLDICSDTDNNASSGVDPVIRFYTNGTSGGGTSVGDIRYDEVNTAFSIGYNKGDIRISSTGEVTFASDINVKDVIVGLGKHIKYNDNNYLDVRDNYGSSWNCTGSIYVNIDDDDNSTTESFVVGHNAAEDGGTELFSVHESNGTKVTGTLEVTSNITIGGNINHDGSNLGVFGTVPTSQQDVSGSKGGNAALGNLITALANYGLITDSTT